MAHTIELGIKAVEKLASIGLTELQITDPLGISRSTLSRRKLDDETFDKALRNGKAKAKAIVNVSSALMTEVEKGSLRGIIFYLECRAGNLGN